MNEGVIFVADVFADSVPGGGELNNEEFINIARTDFKTQTQKKYSHEVTQEFIEENKEKKFIISNFINLREDCKESLRKTTYLIYEHDHKYLKSRNPADFKDYKAPTDQIINYEFYANAAAILCQSALHVSIVKKNLQLDNIINLGGNLWSTEILDLLESLSSLPKSDQHAIMSSNNWHKNTADAVRYCILKEMPHSLIPSAPYKQFLKSLGQHQSLVFFPKTPETLSRIVVEARMMGMSAILNSNVGASSEEWFSLKGAPLINLMRAKRNEIVSKVMESLNAEPNV